MSGEIRYYSDWVRRKYAITEEEEGEYSQQHFLRCCLIIIASSEGSEYRSFNLLLPIRPNRTGRRKSKSRKRRFHLRIQLVENWIPLSTRMADKYNSPIRALRPALIRSNSRSQSSVFALTRKRSNFMQSKRSNRINDDAKSNMVERVCVFVCVCVGEIANKQTEDWEREEIKFYRVCRHNNNSGGRSLLVAFFNIFLCSHWNGSAQCRPYNAKYEKHNHFVCSWQKWTIIAEKTDISCAVDRIFDQQRWVCFQVFRNHNFSSDQQQ